MKGIVGVGASALMLGALLIGVGGCGPQAATAEAPKAQAAPARYETAADKPDPRDAEIPLAKDGKPIWSANKDRTAEENAQAAFDRNGEAFGAKSVDDFVQKAHDFTTSPPSGVQKIKRTNGDTLLYDPKGNVFAVVTKDGAPRTMFKPDDGPAYWQTQKDREASRTAGSGSKSKSKGEG